jgi:hypothetical protein
MAPSPAPNKEFAMTFHCPEASSETIRKNAIIKNRRNVITDQNESSKDCDPTYKNPIP